MPNWPHAPRLAFTHELAFSDLESQPVTLGKRIVFAELVGANVQMEVCFRRQSASFCSHRAFR